MLRNEQLKLGKQSGSKVNPFLPVAPNPVGDFDQFAEISRLVCFENAVFIFGLDRYMSGFQGGGQQHP